MLSHSSKIPFDCIDTVEMWFGVHLSIQTSWNRLGWLRWLHRQPWQSASHKIRAYSSFQIERSKEEKSGRSNSSAAAVVWNRCLARTLCVTTKETEKTCWRNRFNFTHRNTNTHTQTHDLSNSGNLFMGIFHYYTFFIISFVEKECEEIFYPRKK